MTLDINKSQENRPINKLLYGSKWLKVTIVVELPFFTFIFFG